MCADASRIDAYLRCHAHDGEVPDLPFQFDICSSAAGCWGRDTDGCENFLRTQRRGEEIGEELGNWNNTLAIETDGHDLSPQGEHGRRVVVGWISMGQVPTNGGQVAHQRVANDPSGVIDNRVLRPHELRTFEVSLAGKRPDAEKAVPFLELI